MPADAALPAAIWSFGAVCFDERKWELRVGGAVVDIEPRPLEILLCLLRHTGETVTREELVLAVWGHPHLSENTLSNAIAKLRRALGDQDQTTIVTVHRVGYRLAAAVLRREAANPAHKPLSLRAGEAVPRRPDWLLERLLAPSFNSEVWLARHRGSGEQRVFKFSADGQRLSSLKREATLSRLIHGALEDRSDIVRVLDWSFEAPPFFVECEYGGESLQEWADRQGGFGEVPLHVRIDLLARTAEAVAAAHSVGVLHKDLKPSNILIERSAEGHWTVRLTDFGSGGFADPARLAELGAVRMGFTQAADTEALSGTPLYLAPELLQGHAPTVRSDVYALGVMLYQSVVGDLRRPLAPSWERDVADLLLRQDISDAASGDPAHRLSSAGELAERLRRLEARRLERAAALAREAQQEAVRKSLERTRARRPWLFALVLSMFLGLAASLWFFHLSEQARDEALRQFDVTQAVNDFLNNDLIAAANPTVGGSTNVTVLDAIRHAADKIDLRFDHSPRVATALHETVGDTYRTLGNYADAEAQFRQAGRIAGAAFGADSDVAVAADLLLAQILAYENRYSDAQAILDRIGLLSKRKAFSDPMNGVRLWDVRAMLDRHKTNVAAAALDAEQVLAALAALKQHHPRIYDSNTQAVFLAQLHAAEDYKAAGRYRQAEAIERALIEDAGSRRGMADPLTIRAREQLVDTLMDERRDAEAQALLPALMHDASLTLGGVNRLYLNTVREQALIEERRRDWQKALASSRLVEDGYRQLFGMLNDSTIFSVMDSARIAAESGDLQTARNKYEESHAAAIRLQGSNGRLAQLAAYNLANVELDLGQPDDAGKLMRDLSAPALEEASPGTMWEARLSYQRGRLELQSGRAGAARSELEAALQLATTGSSDELRDSIKEELKKLP